MMIKLTNRLIAKYIMQEDPCEYSTNIKQAFRIVNKFRYGCCGHAAAVIEMIVSDTVRYPDCSCTIYSPDTTECVGWGSQMPIAICRAALVFAKKYVKDN